MPSAKLKSLAQFGMSLRRGAYVVHRLETNRCRVKWRDCEPGETVYDIVFLCTGKHHTEPVRLFRKAPRGFKMCEACKNPAEVYKWRAIGSLSRSR